MKDGVINLMIYKLYIKSLFVLEKNHGHVLSEFEKKNCCKIRCCDVHIDVLQSIFTPYLKMFESFCLMESFSTYYSWVCIYKSFFPSKIE